MKFLDDSAWFLLEKRKNHVILTKNLNISQKVKKLEERISNILKILRIPRDPCGDPCGRIQNNTVFLHPGEYIAAGSPGIS